jgi:hypothetical protein
MIALYSYRMISKRDKNEQILFRSDVFKWVKTQKF